MDSYADLARYYDLIMTTGYYDYEAYAQALSARFGPGDEVLEVGVGTGLVCERLLGHGAAGPRLTGVDHTGDMVALARERLGDRVRLAVRDILDLAWPERFDAAYSVGGVWYHVPDGDGIALGSHLLDEEDNVRGLSNLAAALRPGAAFLIAVQPAHRPYDRPLPGGLRYEQRVQSDGPGLYTKDYYVHRQDGTTAAHQRSPFRLFPREHAEDLLKQSGFSPGGPETTTADALLRTYIRV
ncbi:class I SAM-dependent methyltransferase [Streptomyces sp. ODS28]|uniref:class I SAM-dependent methyltransferase n=1 Tax=Streptomyces sp. ODS28 TaxID=3136688 RepID=UPI0031EDA698